MKKYRYIFLAFYALLLLTSNASGQGVASGQAFAQIVGGASISSNTVTQISINSANNGTELDLGKIMIKTGAASLYDIIIEPATLTKKNGDFLILSANAVTSHQDKNNLNNNLTLDLTGNAILKGESGNYQGSYSVILAYN